MIGINKTTPFVTLDDYVDLKGLLDMRGKIVRGIAKSCLAILPGTAGTQYNKIDNSLLDLAQIKEKLIKEDNLPDELVHANQFEREYAMKYMYPSTTMGFCLTLRGGTGPGNYHLKNQSDHVTVFERTDSNFDFMYDWLNKQKIFDDIGRVLFFLSNPYQGSQIHSDYPRLLNTDRVRDQFVWIRFDHRKKFFVYDEYTKEKHYFDGHVTYFNNVDYHGSEPSELPCFSLRIDGRFTEEFLQKVPAIRQYLQAQNTQ